MGKYIEKSYNENCNTFGKVYRNIQTLLSISCFSEMKFMFVEVDGEISLDFYHVNFRIDRENL